MEAIAEQERARMVGWRVAEGRIGVGPGPGQDRSAVKDQVTRPG
jgi:hypothetical protein